MDVIVRFPDDVDELEATILVRDALWNFVELRAKPSIELAVLRQYPEPYFNDRFRADRVASRKRRVEWVCAARVLTFGWASNPDCDD